MRRLFVMMGFVMILTPSVALAADVKLYEKIQKQVLLEILRDENRKPAADREILEFLAALPIEKRFTVTPSEVQSLLSFPTAREVCAEGTPGRPARDAGSCVIIADQFRRLAATEAKMRGLGHELQSIATSYEMPVHSYAGSPATLPSRYRSLVTLWKAGTKDAMKSILEGTIIRGLSLPPSSDSSYMNIVNALRVDLWALEGDERSGAIWRYQHGHRFVAGQRADLPPPPAAPPGSGPGTERQYLTKRWDGSNGSLNIEKKLADLLTRLKQEIEGMTLPLREGEILIFPPVDLDDTIAWVFFELCPTKVGTDTSKCIDLAPAIGAPYKVSADAGLQWRIPLEPVQASIMTDPDNLSGCSGQTPENPNCPAIAGGRYPPEIPDGIGLCGSPLAREGYLCRPIRGLPGDECIGGAAEATDKIVLTRCAGNGPAETLAGPNICRTTLWRNPDTDPDTAKCKDCSVKFICNNAGPGSSGFTGEKEDDGTIPITIDLGKKNDTMYNALHEIKHAQQKCHFPPHFPVFNDTAGCCKAELEANSVSCNAMAEDGLFIGTNITVEQCAIGYAHKSCIASTGAGCGATAEDLGAVNIIENFLETEEALGTCDQLTDATKRDPRVQAMLDGLMNVCNPECKTKYLSTIGNHMCAIGQCMEETLESHRLTPTRSPFTVQDEIFPWESCEPAHPLRAGLYTPPPAVRTTLPSYRPRQLIAALETALCQVNGLPPKQLPIQCGTEATRRLDEPLFSILGTAGGLLNQFMERGLPTATLEMLGAGYGSRIGTGLYYGYLRQTGRSLGEVTRIAAQLLKTLEEVEFTPDMCPRNAAEANGLGAHGVQCNL